MKLAQFLENAEPLKLAIMDYEYADIDVITFSQTYCRTHWKVFYPDKPIPTHDETADEMFFEALNRYLFNRKVSELLIILYLFDLKKIMLNTYQLNKLLKRSQSQYSATYKEVSKLSELDILRTKKVGDNRGTIHVYLNKDVVWIYGDDEFRKAQLDDWHGAKKYIEGKLATLSGQKKKFVERLEGV